MPTPAKDGQSRNSAGATSKGLSQRIRTRSGISTAGAETIAVGEEQPRVEGSLTTAEPDQLLDAYSDFVLYGVFDGGFAKGPEAGVGTTLDGSDATKQMKYWSGPTVVSGAAAYARQIADSQYPSGYALEVTFPASASAEELRFEQTFPLAGSYFRVVGGVARVAGTRTGGGGGISLVTVLDYMGADGTIYLTDTQTSTPGVVFIHTSDQALATPDSRVRKVRIRISAKRDLAHAGTAGTLVFSDVRFDRTTLFQTYADLTANFNPWRVFNRFGNMQYQYEGNTLAGIDGETSPSSLGYPSLWTLSPFGIALQTAPSTPSSGWLAVYPKTDRKVYAKDDLGVETRLTNYAIGTDIEAWDADLDALAALGSTGVAVRTGSGTWTTRTLGVSGAGLAWTNGSGVSGAPTLALADDAAALEALSTTGLAARTALSTWTTRTLTAPAAGITVSNGDGVSGNPTLALANDLSGLEGLSGTGYAVRTGTSTWTTRNVTVSGAGLVIGNTDGVLGDATVSLTGDPAALAALSTTGIAVRTSLGGAWTTRSLVAPAAGLTISNASGVGGAPTFALADDLDGLESLSTTGIAVRTGTGTWTTRSLTAPAAGLAITNASGVGGSPIFALANDLSALEGLSGTGVANRTGTDTWALYALPDVQAFTTTGAGTWTKPTGATSVFVLLVGAGGGGASGRRGAAGTNRFGGGGGGGGGVSQATYLASSLGATVAVSVGAGGPGGATVSADSTNGNSGTAGGDTTFGTTMKAGGGTAGAGGQQGGGGTAGAGGTGLFEGHSGGAGSAGAGANGTYNSGSIAANGGGGGGSGAGITSGDVSAANGGDGSKAEMLGTVPAVGTGATSGAAATNGAVGMSWAGSGGGGGHNSAAHRNGGNGARGAGGGGSAATLNGTATGTGGDGGDGYALVISY